MADQLGLHVEKSLDGRLNMKKYSGFNMNYGGAQINYRHQISASSSGNTSGMSFNPVINTTSIIDRKVFTEINFVLTFTGSSNSGNLLKSGYDAPRSLGSIVSQCQVVINGHGITQESKYVNHWLAHFNEQSKMANALTLAPQMGAYDMTQSYEEADGTFFNSLGDFKYSTPSQTNRGMYRLNVVSNTPTSAVVNLTLYDYIYLSPMVYDNTKHYEGIPNISSLQVNYTFQQIQRIWSHSNKVDNFITDLQVQVNEGYLNFTEITPPADVQVPRSMILDYNEVERRLTNANKTIPAYGTGVLQSNALTLNTIPLKAVIFAKERDADFNSLEAFINKPDVYAGIKKISINYANQSSLFQTCTQEQLYLISSQNGVMGSLESWCGKTQIYDDTLGSIPIALHGSIFVFDFGRDISQQNPSLLPGVSSNVDFSVSEIIIENTSNRQITYDLEIHFIYEAAIEIELGMSRPFRSMVLPSEAVSAPISNSKDNLSGNSFKGMIKSFMTGLVKNPVVRAISSSTADQLLQGPERDLLRKYTGIGVSGNGVVGNGVVGNALVSKKQLRNRM